MAKRKEVQLQSDLQSDEDFDRFLELSGLLVIDVYTEWCGPCLGMLGALKKVKLEWGGDLLNLAIARADTISYIHRFYKKSEPTWLFVTDGRTVNIMFGSDCPKLISLITEEIKAYGKPTTRETYNITEMLPKEIEIDNIKNAVKRAKLQKEIDEQERKRNDYFNYVTDTIIENLPDIGITIFGPHISRDNFRHLLDYGAEKFGIQCKDRRNQPISREQFKTINYVCKNPLPPEVLDAIDGKELHICFWKVPDEFKEPIPEVLQRYADDIGKSHKLPPDEYRAEEEIIPPLAMPAKVKVEYELPAGIECPKDSKQEEVKEPQKQRISETHADSPHSSLKQEREATEGDEGESEDKENEGEGQGEEQKLESPEMPDVELNLDGSMLNEGEEEFFYETPKKNICTKTVTIPAIWVPKDLRTHAAIIYVIFRGQTNAFLPPDPVPDPPHVIMAFDTYKKRDLIDFAERYKEDIPLYGFFTSDEAEEAKLIANSKQKYAHHTPAASDKLIFKVNKRTSHTMLSLATYGPTYVSPNTVVGAEEANIFFPEDYVSAEQELLETLAKKDDGKKKSKKGRKSMEDLQGSYERLQAEAAAIEAAEEAKKALESKETRTEGQTEVDATEGVEFEATKDEATGVGLEQTDEIAEVIEVQNHEEPTQTQTEEPTAAPPEELAQAPTVDATPENAPTETGETPA